MAEWKLPNINFIILSGRVVQPPELKYTPSGKPVVKIRVANSRRFRDVTNEWQEETLFIDVIAWGEMAERAHDRLVKGSPLLVEGTLRQRTWDKDDQKRSIYEIRALRIHFLEKIKAPEEAPTQSLDEIQDEELIQDEETELPF